MLNEEQKKIIVGAIKAAELNTSGEVKVHIEHHCTLPDVMDRAKEVFGLLNLQNTKLRNGVLFYLAITDKKFAILGDTGIDTAVADDFWENTRDILKKHFSVNEIAQGLALGIDMAGHQLKKYFPYQSDDINEISDDISFGN
jgi:uncharacterized membrane protein